jgi:hypothetical protein
LEGGTVKSFFERRVLWAAAALFALAAATVPAQSRSWSKNPISMALDYAVINDNRGDGEIVNVIWLAPTILANTPSTETARNLLDKNIVIGVVHTHAAKDGTMTFEQTATVEASAATGEPLKLLDTTTMAPAVIGALATMQSVFSRNLGPFGKGVQWFVFDSGGMRACAKGGFSIQFAGEKYGYETPMPGCP